MLDNGSDLRRLRRAAGLTQADLSYFSGISEWRIAAIEAGGEPRVPERGALEAVLRQEILQRREECDLFLQGAEEATVSAQ